MDWLVAIAGKFSGPLGWVASFAANTLSRMFKDWRRDGDLKDLGAAEQANKASAEAEKRGNEGDDIDRRIEAATDDELNAMLRGDK